MTDSAVMRGIGIAAVVLIAVILVCARTIPEMMGTPHRVELAETKQQLAAAETRAADLSARLQAAESRITELESAADGPGKQGDQRPTEVGAPEESITEADSRDEIARRRSQKAGATARTNRGAPTATETTDEPTSASPSPRAETIASPFHSEPPSSSTCTGRWIQREDRWSDSIRTLAILSNGRFIFRSRDGSCSGRWKLKSDLLFWSFDQNRLDAPFPSDRCRWVKDDKGNLSLEFLHPEGVPVNHGQRHWMAYR